MGENENVCLVYGVHSRGMPDLHGDPSRRRAGRDARGSAAIKREGGYAALFFYGFYRTNQKAK